MRTARGGLAAILLVALAACPGKGKPARGPSGSRAPAGVRGGTLHVSLSEDVDAIDPQRAGAPASFGLARALHRGLMAFPAAAWPEGARPVPDLAAGPPEVSADGLHYSFRLRDDIAFGPPASRPVRAADVKAGLERVFIARSPMAGYFRVIAGADALAARKASGLSGVTTPDDHTVVVSLVRPANDLLWLLALPAASAVPPGLPPAARPKDISPSGPYRLAPEDGYVPERSIHLIRNDAWTEESDPVRHAWVDQVRFDIGLSAGEIAQRVSDGRTDLVGDEPPPGSTAKDLPPEQTVGRARGCLRYLFLNTRVAPFSSVGVRRAVAAAIDRDAVAATYGSAATPAATIIPPTVDGYDPERPVPGADPSGARAMLAAAGHSGGFATLLVAGDLAEDRAQAAAVRTALARAGVRVTIATVPIASLYEDRYEVAGAAVPMGIATWCADWPGLGGRGALAPLVDGKAIRPRGSSNYAGVNSPALNRAMDAASVERDPVRAAAAWAACDRQALAISAVVPLAHLGSVSPLGRRVRGFVPHPFFVRGDLTAVWIAAS